VPYDFSINFPVVERRLTDLKFYGNFGYLPGFGKAITLPPFQEDRRYNSLRK
jgi:hypothetical protein